MLPFPEAERTRRKCRRRTLLVVIAALLASGPGVVDAGVLRYTLEIRDREATSYVLELPVEHPGTLRVEARWPGRRVLSLRLEGPGDPPVTERRTGPSPLTLEAEVADPSSGWTLHIRAVPAHGDTRGTLTIDLPAPPATEPAGSTLERVPAPDHEPEPWSLPQPAPPGSEPSLVRLFDAVEGLRARVFADDETSSPDACGWQEGLLRYAVDSRDRRATAGGKMTEATRRYLRRLAAAVDRVEELRSTSDPILAGPPPDEPLRRQAWRQVRKQRLMPLVDELDGLGAALRRGYVPELASAEWPRRFVGCLMACERHFDQRAEVGDEQASNGDLAHEQWDAFLAAATVLDALAARPRGAADPPAPERAARPASEAGLP